MFPDSPRTIGKQFLQVGRDDGLDTNYNLFSVSQLIQDTVRGFRLEFVYVDASADKRLD